MLILSQKVYFAGSPSFPYRFLPFRRASQRSDDTSAAPRREGEGVQPRRVSVQHTRAGTIQGATGKPTPLVSSVVVRGFDLPFRPGSVVGFDGVAGGWFPELEAARICALTAVVRAAE